MLSAYPACFFKEKNGAYSVIFPDLNLATCGDNLNQALDKSVELLADYLYQAKLDKDKIPTPSDITTIDMKKIAKDLDSDDYDGFVNLVMVDVEDYAKKHFEKSVKKTLTIPSWLNTLAIENNINFSRTLQNALRKELNV